MSETSGDPRRGLKAWHHVAKLPPFPVDPARTALCVIDLTLQQASRTHGVCRRCIDDGFGDDVAYYLDRVENTLVPAVGRLLAHFRASGAPIVHTRCVSLRGDGSDQTWRHRAFGLVCSIDSEDAQFLPGVAPQAGEIVLNKTGSGMFNSTNAEHLFRNMGVTTLIMTGVFTNSCVETATRDAGDRDFRVLLAEDGCAAMSPIGHRNALDYLDANFCHVKSTTEILRLLSTPSAMAAE